MREHHHREGVSRNCLITFSNRSIAQVKWITQAIYYRNATTTFVRNQHACITCNRSGAFVLKLNQQTISIVSTVRTDRIPNVQLGQIE